MTRLFILLYLGVLAVLFAAWYIHGTVSRHRAEAEHARVFEEAHGGGARLVADEIDAVPVESREQTLDRVRRRFDYAVDIIPLADLPPDVRRKLANGKDVVFVRGAFDGEGSPESVVAALSSRTEVVRLGPFPNYPRQGIEGRIGGWMRLTADKLDAAADRQVVLENLRQRFDVPVTVIRSEDLPRLAKWRLAAGADVVFYPQDPPASDQWFAATPLSNGIELIRCGPFPNFENIEERAATTTLALVLFPAALAIALLLRPVARQLRHVENAAKSIAAGDLSARVDERKVKSARTLAQAFNNMAGRTESMLRTQTELLQAVSHELRTPLSRIHFAIDLIRSARDDQQRETRLDSLDTAAEDLDELVGELLRYVRMEMSQPQLELEEVQLRPLVEELCEKQSLLHPATEFEIAESLDREQVLYADRANLNRALRNTIANAGRFARNRVVITASETTEGMVIDVDDDGPGISTADRERVFDPFVRLGESDNGVGLGLALVQRIVANHGGSVTAQESPLGGCRIRMTLPASDLCRASSEGRATQAMPRAVS